MKKKKFKGLGLNGFVLVFTILIMTAPPVWAAEGTSAQCSRGFTLMGGNLCVIEVMTFSGLDAEEKCGERQAKLCSSDEWKKSICPDENIIPGEKATHKSYHVENGIGSYASIGYSYGGGCSDIITDMSSGFALCCKTAVVPKTPVVSPSKPAAGASKTGAK